MFHFQEQGKSLIKYIQAKYMLFYKLSYVVISSQALVFPFFLNN